VGVCVSCLKIFNRELNTQTLRALTDETFLKHDQNLIHLISRLLSIVKAVINRYY